MSKQVFEGVVRKHTDSPVLKVIDVPDKLVSEGWIAISSDHPAKVGERYRVTIERLRAPLPDGYEWDGNMIVCRVLDARWVPAEWKIAGQPFKAISATAGTRSVPSFVIDAFKAEGLL